MTRTKLLAWLPAMLALGVGLVAASGLSVIAPAGAASSPQTYVGRATVNPELHMGTCATDSGTLTLGAASAENIGDGCAMTFGTNNNTAGVTLMIENNASNEFLCFGQGGARNCATAAYTDAAAMPAGEATATLSSGEAGWQLTAAQSAAPAATKDVAGAVGTTVTYGVPANLAPADVCHSTALGDSSCTVQFVALTGAAQQAGDYEGVVKLSVSAR